MVDTSRSNKYFPFHTSIPPQNENRRSKKSSTTAVEDRRNNENKGGGRTKNRGTTAENLPRLAPNLTHLSYGVPVASPCFRPFLTRYQMCYGIRQNLAQSIQRVQQRKRADSQTTFDCTMSCQLAWRRRPSMQCVVLV